MAPSHLSNSMQLPACKLQNYSIRGSRPDPLTKFFEESRAQAHTGDSWNFKLMKQLILNKLSEIDPSSPKSYSLQTRTYYP